MSEPHNYSEDPNRELQPMIDYLERDMYPFEDDPDGLDYDDSMEDE